MDRKQVLLDDGQMARQREFTEKIHAMHQARGRTPLALVDTFGCQQNVADSQHILGMLRDMGCEFTDDAARADIVVMNTCAIRDHAEKRVYGTLGALTHTKKANPEQIICLCGCMMQEPTVIEKIKNSYRFVDLIFGTHNIFKFAELLCSLFENEGMVIDIWKDTDKIVEDLPVERKYSFKSGINIMFGCNNFCSYCIVPYVRGRERSRNPKDIIREIEGLVADGVVEIMLLGQNVNSYGKNLEEPITFAQLLQEVERIEGLERIRFMTSHPKDATQKLFETMARCGKVAPVLHLPFQAGNDRILKAMNRVYDRAGYLDKVRRLRQAIPDVGITSDVIVGFPGETAEEFEDTMTLIDEVRFDALFTFIFSPREGTPAAKMDDPIPKAEKAVHFQRLVERQDQISEEKHAAYIGKTVRCLVDGRDGKGLTARTPGNRLVRLTGDEGLIGQFVDVKITGANKWSLSGEPA